MVKKIFGLLALLLMLSVDPRPAEATPAMSGTLYVCHAVLQYPGMSSEGTSASLSVDLTTAPYCGGTMTSYYVCGTGATSGVCDTAFLFTENGVYHLFDAFLAAQRAQSKVTVVVDGASGHPVAIHYAAFYAPSWSN